jgi:hypothetical protein
MHSKHIIVFNDHLINMRQMAVLNKTINNMQLACMRPSNCKHRHVNIWTNALDGVGASSINQQHLHINQHLEVKPHLECKIVE